MPIEKELDIAQQQRKALLGSAGEVSAKRPAAGESMVERVSRQRGYSKTMGPARKMQDQYREKHGLDQMNRPMKKTASRETSRR